VTKVVRVRVSPSAPSVKMLSAYAGGIVFRLFMMWLCYQHVTKPGENDVFRICKFIYCISVIQSGAFRC